MIRYISQEEINEFLVVPKEQAEYIFSQVVLLRGCEGNPPKIKLSDLMDTQFYFAHNHPNVPKPIKRIVQKATMSAATPVENILNNGVNLWDLISGKSNCPNCGQVSFNRNCELCLKRYNLPKDAIRIEMAYDDVYPALSLGYIVELMPIPESGPEFRLAKVKIDGYKNTGFVYLKNTRIIE